MGSMNWGMEKYTPRWIYQARRVATQANAAGGAIKIDISLATGQVARIVSMAIANSGTNSITVELQDEDGAVCGRFAGIGSGAGTQGFLPSIGTVANASANIEHTIGMLVPPGAMLTIYQGGAGAQNDTLTIGIVLELFNLSTEPTWSKARSTNQANVTLAASTISATNTVQRILTGPY